MFKSLWGYLEDIKINDFKFFDETWKQNEKRAKKELGSKECATGTLKELEDKISGGQCEDLRSRGSVIWHHCKNRDLHETVLDFLKMLNSVQPGFVGDPDDVHHIVSPQHSIGYALYKSEDGRLTNEHIEGLYKILSVLRRNGRVIAVNSTGVLRHESCHGHHVG